jgi:hypothetical protein
VAGKRHRDQLTTLATGRRAVPSVGTGSCTFSFLRGASALDTGCDSDRKVARGIGHAFHDPLLLERHRR